MKTWSRILCAAAMAFVVAAGIPCWVQADGSTARTIQLDGMSYTETVGADGSIIETPDGLKGTFPQYDPATGWLTVRALVVIFDKNQSTRPDVEPFQIGLQAFQDCFYDHSGEMKKWYPNQSNLSPGYDRLYPQKIHQIVTWKYYPNLMPITADQYEDAAYMRDWMNTYVEPGYQMIYLSDNIRIESNNVSNKSGSTWWQKSAAPGFDQYATNAIFLGFDMMGQTGDHGLGHAIEEIMDKLAPFIWSDDYDSLNEWSKFCCSKVTTPSAPKKDSDFAGLHGSFGRPADQTYGYPGWSQPGDLLGMTQMRYEAAWCANVPHLANYLASFWLDYYPEANVIPDIAGIPGIALVNTADTAPAPPSAQPAAEAATAVPTSSKVLINGVSVTFDAYNINGYNYFKLRDLAYALSGTEKQFDVGWDGANNAISLTSGRAYTVAGGEMTGKSGGEKNASPTSSIIYLDGTEVSFTAYNIDDSNYFKLRDISQAFDFGVGWDAATSTITIDTSEGYEP